MGFPSYLPTVALFCVLLFGSYLAWEIWAWFSGNRGELTPGQFRRRLCGGAMLLAAMVMLMMGEVWMTGRPAKERLVYLGWMMVLTLIPVMLAVREAAFIARQYARKRADLLRNLGNRE